MNRLGNEPSLYLRQHADNPVHWQPWDDEALQAARDSGRPILLSIGYSACHWCHVMAHESFEDPATADLMNRLFVNIKVDREERPDLDRVYQLAHQLLTGRGGGWPLTVFLDPTDQVPFFAGTYFPLARRYGMPAFREVLQAVHNWYTENRDEVGAQNDKLRAAVESIQGAGAGAALPADEDRAEQILRTAAEQLAARHDPDNGGYGGAPKFPQAPLLEAVAALAGSPAGAGLAGQLEFTLGRMAASGLRDHLDGGFFRYCVDGSWTIPHFEKMLYDNAMLLPLYAEGARRWGNPELEAAARGIADWLLSEMHAPGEGYAASIDADAGGHEGGFHVWRADEIESLLEPAEWPLFRRAYGLDLPPNFEGHAWHLQRRCGSAELAAEFGLPEDQVESLLARARRRLRREREARVHPTRDDKRLASWNALLAGGFARAGKALGEAEWIDRAEEILAFIQRALWTGDGLLAVYHAGSTRFAAYLDDYAWLLRALLDLLSARWSERWLGFAVEVADALLRRFEEQVAGGFYFSDASVEVPIARGMPFGDDATPAGNAVAILALNRLAHLLGEPRYAEAAERCLVRGLPRVAESPLGHASLLLALQDAVRPPPHLVIGGADADAGRALQQWAESRYRVDCYLVGSATAGLPGVLSGYGSAQPVTAWLCEGMRCLPPVGTREELEALMG